MFPIRLVAQPQGSIWPDPVRMRTRHVESAHSLQTTNPQWEIVGYNLLDGWNEHLHPWLDGGDHVLLQLYPRRPFKAQRNVILVEHSRERRWVYSRGHRAQTPSM